MNRILIRLAILAVASVIALLAAEAFIRLLPLLPVNAMGTVMRPDPILDHSLRPGARGRMMSMEYNVTYAINSLGMRDDDLDDADRSGRLLLLGDSFMEGYGVERGLILADRVEQPGRIVMNAGVKSYSPLLEYLYLRHRGLVLKPDTVVLFFDLSDPANDAYYTRRLITDDSGLPLAIRPRRAGALPLTGPTAQFLENYSALFCYLRHAALKYLPAGREDVGYAGAALDLEPLFPGRDAIPDSDYYHRWEPSLRYLRLVRDLLADRGVAFRLVIYPYGHQVSADAWAEGRRAHNFPPGVSSRRPEEFLLRFASAEGIPTLSLWDTFRNHPDPGSLYFRHDGHWTAAGHAVAAEAVSRWLEN